MAAPAASAAAVRSCNYSNLEPTTGYGASGAVVRQIQCELNLAMDPWDFPSISVDGQFGPATQQRVRDLQYYGCLNSVDGIVGNETWFYLDAWAESTNSITKHHCR